MTTDSNNRRSKILFIEDESGFRQVIAELLLKHGFEVLEAADGKEGLRCAAESLPDLILCDLLMPEMNGYEVLAALQREERLADIPILFLTAQSEPAEVRQGMNLGADDYVPGRRSAHYEAVADLGRVTADLLRERIPPDLRGGPTGLAGAARMAKRLPAGEEKWVNSRIRMLQNCQRKVRHLLRLVGKLLTAGSAQNA